MFSRFLYFVTDCDSPRFAASAKPDFYPVINIAPDFSDFNWFNWDAQGCLIFEFEDIDYAVRLLQKIRCSWISVPTVLYGTRYGNAAEIVQSFGFSVVVGESIDARSFNCQLEMLMDRDRIGEPSPFELRQRLGGLSSQQRHVLSLSLQGWNSREIASELGVRYQTVDKYKRNALERMKVNNLLILLRLLYESVFQFGEHEMGGVAAPPNQNVPELSLPD